MQGYLAYTNSTMGPRPAVIIYPDWDGKFHPLNQADCHEVLVLRALNRVDVQHTLVTTWPHSLQAFPTTSAGGRIFLQLKAT